MPKKAGKVARKPSVKSRQKPSEKASSADLDAEFDEELPADVVVPGELEKTSLDLFTADVANAFRLTNAQLAIMLKLSRQHVGELRAAPLYKYKQAEFLKSTIHTHKELELKAAKTLNALMSSKDEKVALFAAREVWEPKKNARSKALAYRFDHALQDGNGVGGGSRTPIKISIKDGNGEKEVDPAKLIATLGDWYDKPSKED